jgi:hypothetical protein
VEQCHVKHVLSAMLLLVVRHDAIPRLQNPGGGSCSESHHVAESDSAPRTPWWNSPTSPNHAASIPPEHNPGRAASPKYTVKLDYTPASSSEYTLLTPSRCSASPIYAPLCFPAGLQFVSHIYLCIWIEGASLTSSSVTSAAGEGEMRHNLNV